MKLCIAALLAVVSAIVFLLSGSYPLAAWVDSEIRADLGETPIGPHRSSFGLSPTSPPPATLKNTADAWVGTWDTVTSDGSTYTIQLSKQGSRIVGFIPHVDRRFAARFYGAPNPAGDEMTFSFTQPATGDVSRGVLRLTNKETFAGSFVKDNVPDKTFTWNGTRRQ